jgi:hypothetical protein
VLYFKRLRHDLDSMLCPAVQAEPRRRACRMAQRGQSIRSMLWIKIDANCDRDHGASLAIDSVSQDMTKRDRRAPFPESRAKPVCPGARKRSMHSRVTCMTGPSGEAFHCQQSERRSRPASASTTLLSRKRNPKSSLIGLAWKGDDHDRGAPRPRGRWLCAAARLALLLPSQSRDRTGPGLDERDYPRWVEPATSPWQRRALVNQVGTTRAGRRGPDAEPEQSVMKSACLAQQEASRRLRPWQHQPRAQSAER